MASATIISCPTAKVSTDAVFTNRFDFTLNTYEDRYVIIAGGCTLDSHDWIKSATIFDLQKKEHISLPNLPVGYKRIFGTIIKDYFYAILYIFLKGRLHIYRINLSARRNSKWEWEAMTGDRIISRNPHTKFVSDGNGIFMFGINDKLMYYSSRDELVELSTLDYRFNIRTGVVVQRKIYATGEDHNYQMCVKIYDIPSCSWHNVHVPRKKSFLFNALPYALGNRWIFYRSNRLVGLLYDTYTNVWIEINVLFSPSRSVRITGSAVISGYLIAYTSIEEKKGAHGIIDYNEGGLSVIERKHIVPNWFIVKDLILLRKLVDSGRADTDPVNKRRKFLGDKCHETNGKIIEKDDIIIQELIISLDFDMFVLVLKFL